MNSGTQFRHIRNLGHIPPGPRRILLLNRSEACSPPLVTMAVRRSTRCFCRPMHRTRPILLCEFRTGHGSRMNRSYVGPLPYELERRRLMVEYGRLDCRELGVFVQPAPLQALANPLKVRHEGRLRPAQATVLEVLGVLQRPGSRAWLAHCRRSVPRGDDGRADGSGTALQSRTTTLDRQILMGMSAGSVAGHSSGRCALP